MHQTLLILTHRAQLPRKTDGLCIDQVCKDPDGEGEGCGGLAGLCKTYHMKSSAGLSSVTAFADISGCVILKKHQHLFIGLL